MSNESVNSARPGVESLDIQRNVGENIHDTARGMPLDGNLYAVNEYLKAIAGDSDPQFYRMYVNHIRYYTNQYKIKGSYENYLLGIMLIRQLVEFGKAAIVKVNGKAIVLAVSTVETNLDGTVKSLVGTRVRDGYSYNKGIKTFTFKGKDVVFIKSNFQALPFIFFWKEVIDTMIKLRSVAMTASVISIKKFKRGLSNNDSEIAKMETESMLDTKNPYVIQIQSPATYFLDGDGTKANDRSVAPPNNLTFEGSGNIDVGGLWDNLQKYMEFEYFQNGRKINTNKKNERNVSKEIDTETINFDILEDGLKTALKMGVKRANEILGLELEFVSLEEELTQDTSTDVKEEKDVKV